MNIRNPDITKINILLAAEEEFARWGFHGARINRIAEKARANKRMIYHYFGSKEVLHKKVLEYNYQKVIKIEKIESLLDDNVERAIRDTISRYFWFLRDNPNFVKILAWEGVLTSPYNKKTLTETLAPAFYQLFDFYKRGCEKGVFRKNVDLKNLIISTHSMCLITFSRQEVIVENDSEQSLKKRLQHISEMIINYLKNK